MSILFVGALAPEFINGRLVTTPAAAFDANYAPGALSILSGDNVTRAVATLLSTSDLDTWVHFRYYQTERQMFNGDSDLIGLYSLAGDRLCALSGTYAGGGLGFQFKALSGISGYVAADIKTLIPVGVACTIDMHCVRSGGTITASLYIDGLLAVTLTASTTVTSGAATVRYGNQLTTSPAYFSEMIVTGEGECTIGWRLSSMLASSDGSVTQWTGSFADLATADTATGIWTDAINKVHTGYFMVYNGATNPLGIRALVQVGRFTENTSGMTLQGVLYDTAVRTAYTQNYTDASRVITIWDNNPVSAAPWQVTDFDDFQGGLKSLAA